MSSTNASDTTFSSATISNTSISNTMMTSTVFVIRNQLGQYLTRGNEWVDGYDAAPLYKTPFRDVALNSLSELNAKDIELRGEIIEVDVNERGLPVITSYGVALEPDVDTSAENTETAVNNGY